MWFHLAKDNFDKSLKTLHVVLVSQNQVLQRFSNKIQILNILWQTWLQIILFQESLTLERMLEILWRLNYFSLDSINLTIKLPRKKDSWKKVRSLYLDFKEMIPIMVQSSEGWNLIQIY